MQPPLWDYNTISDARNAAEAIGHINQGLTDLHDLNGYRKNEIGAHSFTLAAIVLRFRADVTCHHGVPRGNPTAVCLSCDAVAT